MAHILLAEDDESLRKFLAAALVKAGHAVTDFGDGSDAWECIQGFTFDLLLTDIVMPGMDGIELAKRAAERNATLKIMFITGFAAVALHPASNAPKQAKVLSKPFHLREIVAEVERMIAAYYAAVAFPKSDSKLYARLCARPSRLTHLCARRRATYRACERASSAPGVGFSRQWS